MHVSFAELSSRVSVSNAVWPLIDAWRNYARITTATNAAIRLYIRPEPVAVVAAFFFPTVLLLNLELWQVRIWGCSVGGVVPAAGLEAQKA